MGITVPVETVANADAVIVLDDEIEGETMTSSNYGFRKIGSEVRVMSDKASVFVPKCPPLKPLAVSERFRLLFVAHPKGFSVTRTADVMTWAAEGTCSSVQESSLVDVPLENVSILSLSSDDALLAACLTNIIHFFAVSALLHKEQKPSFSISLDDTISIKDMCWSKKLAKVYLILSADGKLYHGSGQGPLNLVTEGVDCVAWSAQENIVALAKKNIVSILSPQFKEKLQLVLPFQSIVDGNDVNQVIKVNSIQWIRPDCIAVGCFHLYDDGEEQSCIFQLISSENGSITDISVSSKPTVVSFNDVYLDPCPDPSSQTGSQLFLSYLDQYRVAFITNLNVSRRVGLICWFLENGKNEAAIVDMEKESWNMQIDYADNENNVILGLAIDKLSQNENARFISGIEEKFAPPFYLIACLTVDGNISVFLFASAAGTLIPQEGFSHDEEDDTSLTLIKPDLPQISSSLVEENTEPTLSVSEHAEVNLTKPDRSGFETVKLDKVDFSSSLNGTLGSNTLDGAVLSPSNEGIHSHLHLMQSARVQGNRNPPSTYTGSQEPLDRSAIAKRPFQHESYKELAATSFPSKHPLLHASRNIGNVEEMTKALDNLLEEIEVKGGYIDSSISSQTSLVMELEEDTRALSEKYRMSKGFMDKKLMEVRLLLDKTVQVMTKKVNIEGILNQAMDSRYWELWNRQKLSYEMELKLKSISQSEQVLINKLIELERHFNNLELNKFGENVELPSNRRHMQNLPSHLRQIKSLQSLCNTMHAQLEAAERLSGCLTEQMASLRIESSEKHDMKRQLFESVGLSPLADRASSFPSDGGLLTSFSVAGNEGSGRNQASILGGSEQETARRQRYSLDHSWASIDPPKTTVKRVVKKDYDKSSDKLYLSPDAQKKSQVTPSAHSANRGSLSHYENRGSTELRGEPFNENRFRSFSQKTVGLPDPGINIASTGSFPALSSGSILHSVDGNSRSLSASGKSGMLFATESKLGQKSSEVMHQSPTLSRATSGSGVSAAEENETPVLQKTIASTSFLSSKLSSLPSENGTSGFGFRASEEKETPLLHSVLTSSSPTYLSSKTSAPSSENRTSGFGFSASEEKEMPLPQRTLVSTPFLSSNLISPSTENKTSGSDISASEEKKAPQLQRKLSSTLDHSSKVSSVPTESKLSPESFTSGPLTTSDSKREAHSQVSVASSGFGQVVSSAPTPWSINLGSGKPFDLGGSSAVESESSFATTVPSVVEVSHGGILDVAKKVASDDVEEMEEEAPETSKTSGISLGGFGGFGIGSNLNTATAQPTKNPFGVTLSSATFGTFPSYTAPAAQSDLFRPASFNLPSSQPATPFNSSTGFGTGIIPGHSSGMAGFGQPATPLNSSTGFGSVSIPGQSSGMAGFGQPAAVGAGQQAIGSVLGSFGQSRQLGPGFASGSGFGSASAGGGAVGSGGFAGVASGFGGFSAAASGGLGFAGAATASSQASSGFGAFSNNQQGGVSGFGGRPPSEMFTQMRK